MFLIESVIYAVVFYAAILVLMFVFQRNFVFLPNTEDAFSGEYAPFTVFEYQSPSGLKLRGLWAKAQPGQPTIVLFHGNAGHAGDRLFKATPFVNKGYGYAIVGYRGYGGNPGQPDEQGLYDDARSVIAYLEEQGVEAKDMVFYGESLGTGVAVQMATEHPEIKAVVLEAPYTSLVDVGAGVYWYLPVRYLMKYRFDSIRKITRLSVPLLIVHGTKDRVVPYALGKKLYEAATMPRKQLLTVENGTHNDLYDHKAAEAINAFLETLD